MPQKLDIKHIISLGILFAFLVNVFGPMPSAYAQELYVSKPGQMVALSPAFSPAVLKGIKLDTKNPFQFHFFVDKGEANLSQEELKEESSKLIKYFLASLTIPEKDLWVNLSPYEKDRIVPDAFGQTAMGRDLLAQDYMLKQVTASLIYPESQLGKEFWKKVYTQAQAKYGKTEVPINTFNKVWIVPEKAVVYENGGAAFVLENHLKVMLEEDYLSLEKHKGIQSKQAQAKDTNQIGSQIVREIVIPALTKEVNDGKNFAQLRQVFNSLILATWYKKKIKNSILNKVYSNRNKIIGINMSTKDNDKIYQDYLKAFKKGVYNYIKEEPDIISNQTVLRKYFSGGVCIAGYLDHAMSIKNEAQVNPDLLVNFARESDLEEVSVDVRLISQRASLLSDKAMASQKEIFGNEINFVIHKAMYIRNLSKELRESKIISYFEDLQINRLIQHVLTILDKKVLPAKYNYVYRWLREFEEFMTVLKVEDLNINAITQLNRFIKAGNIIMNIPQEYFNEFSEDQISVSVNVLIGYLEVDYQKEALIKKLQDVFQQNESYIKEFLYSVLFIDDEIRHHIVYQTVAKGKRQFMVTAKRPDGSSLKELSSEKGGHTFSKEELKDYITRFEMPEDIYQSVVTSPHQSSVVIHVGNPGISYIKQLLDDGFILHSFRKNSKEKQYHNRSFYYKKNVDGSVDVVFVNIVGFTNLRDLIDFYLTMVNAVSIVDNMPDYEQMLSFLTQRVSVDSSVDMIGVSAGYGMGTHMSNEFYSFYDSFYDSTARDENNSPYLFRLIKGSIKGRSLAGFNITFGDLGAYSARFLLDRFPAAGSFLTAGIVGFVGDQRINSSETVLPGDIFIPTSISSNFSNTKIDNLYTKALIDILDENKISYEIIDMQEKQKQIISKRIYNTTDNPIRIVMGKLFSVDSIAIETNEVTKIWREKGICAIDMEAALMVDILQSIKPGIKLYMGYIISDIPGYINWESRYINHELKSLIQQRVTLAEKVLNLTGLRILQNEEQRDKDEAMKAQDLENLKRGTDLGGIDMNPAQMSMQVNNVAQNSKFDFDGREIDAVQVAGLTFTIRAITPVSNLPMELGLTHLN